MPEAFADADTRPPLTLSGQTAVLSGPWVLEHLPAIEPELTAAAWPAGPLCFDLHGIERLDTAGAWLVRRTIARLETEGRTITIENASPLVSSLLDTVSRVTAGSLEVPVTRRTPGRALLAAGAKQLRGYTGLLTFLGELAVVGLPLLARPIRIRWSLVVEEIAESGYRALPIVGLLSFLLGVVIAYQGGVLLRQYGANLFIADLVGFSMLRELSPLITAIIVAGRTGSAYTAQIGTMKVTEEVNALAAMGVRPLEYLVLPKLVALLVSLTLLTVWADLLGVLGGGVIASGLLNISPGTFIDRLLYAVTVGSFAIGIGKAPVFAAIIAWIGSYQGFEVSGGAENVGRHTTLSVVQAIFLVIVVDAAFSIIFNELGI